MYYNHQSRAPRGHASSSSASASAANAISSFADWAARSLDPDVKITPVQSYVERCCDPINTQPNIALNLELADYIKQKQANTPREAAIAVVQRINSRHPHVSQLALDLLDHLVKNVGYPFHLQIATKEFLNELVKRFPERPPLFPSQAQTRILSLINEWKNTLCVDSRRKEDLVHIRDMHRLLTYKGYRFPTLDSRSKGVLNPQNNLQTPEELEEEDRAAQAAKLQELIRRGTPRDLEQAQELMKIMSGAEPERKPDYALQTAKELDKVQSRAFLLNDMLNNYQEGEKFVRGDGYDQIASHLRSVQPRLQKWISQEEDTESEQIDRLLLLNDLVNQVCERYDAFKKGDFAATVNIDPSIDPAKGGAAAVPTAKMSDLISFEDENASADASAPGKASHNIMDDFASLTFENSATQTASSQQAKTISGLPLDLFDSTKLSHAPSAGANLYTPPSTLRPTSSGATFPPTTAATAGSDGTSSPLGDWGALQLPMGVNTAARNGPSNTPSQPPSRQSTKAKDPFEDLLS